MEHKICRCSSYMYVLFEFLKTTFLMPCVGGLTLIPLGGAPPPPVIFFAVHLDRLEFRVQTSWLRSRG